MPEVQTRGGMSDRGARPPLAQGEPAAWTRRDAVAVFAQLAAPETEELPGRWNGEFVGRTVLAATARAIAAVTPLRGWCGKHVSDRETLRNLVRRGDGVHESVAAELSRGRSRFDDEPVIAVSYRKTARPPVSFCQAELRWLVPGEELLGLLSIVLGPLAVGPFPFRLQRRATDAV